MLNLGRLSDLVRADLIGDPEQVVVRARPFEAAGAGDVTLAAEPRYLDQLAQSRATAIIVGSRLDPAAHNLLVAANPKLAFARAIQCLHTRPRQPGRVSDDLKIGEASVIATEARIYPRVTIGAECSIGNRVSLYPGVVIGDRCSIGDDTVVFSNATLYDDCTIGARVVIHAGAVIGGDGFGFVADEDGKQVKILQLGTVIVEDDCEIGANCTIDRGGFGATTIRRGVKLDNLIQVGHGSDIGEDTVVAALTGFSGGTTVGRGCVVGGQVGTNQHVSIGAHAVVTARSGVTKSVKPDAVIGGMIAAADYNSWRRANAVYVRLPEVFQRLRAVERAIEAGRKTKT